ncbi:MAG TPA: hypothetical protein ENI23_05440 [bacterium]|nr:hypothetical protein [bacterium]
MSKQRQPNRTPEQKASDRLSAIKNTIAKHEGFTFDVRVNRVTNIMKSVKTLTVWAKTLSTNGHRKLAKVAKARMAELAA